MANIIEFPTVTKSMVMDYHILVCKIEEVFGSQNCFADAMGMEYKTLQRKLNNEIDWQLCEINKAMDILGVPPLFIDLFFFTEYKTTNCM